jgi:hypothetical protein
VSRDVKPPTIVVDTREQAPWVASVRRDQRRILLPVVRRALVAGDYTIEGYEHEIAIERKSLADWIGTMFGASVDALGERATSWERFRRELARVREGVTPTDGSAPTPPLRRFAVMVEASREDVYQHRYRSGVLPQSVIGRSDSVWADHGVPVLWASAQAVWDRARLEWSFATARAEQEGLAMWTLLRWWERRELEKGATSGDISRAFKAAEPLEPPARAPRPYDPGERDPYARARAKVAR